MKDAQGQLVLGGTRWKRFAAVMVPTVGAAGAMTLMMAQGALASSFAVSGTNFKVSANSLDGSNFEQFGDLDYSKNKTKVHPVAVSAIGDATLDHLCQSVKVGPVTLRITAGEGDKKVKASNLVVDAEQLNGDAEFKNIQIGRDASTLDRIDGVRGAEGMFGQQADHVTITNLQQTAWATSAGTFKLNGLHLALGFGSTDDHRECF